VISPILLLYFIILQIAMGDLTQVIIIS